MARQQTQSAKDNDPGCHVGRVRKVVVLFVWERRWTGGQLTRWRILDDLKIVYFSVEIIRWIN
jgi:hypothetical protein